MRVLGPGVGRAAFRQHGTELWVGQHVRPRRRCHEPRRGCDHVFTPIGSKAPDAIPEDEVGARPCGVGDRRGGFHTLAPDGERRWVDSDPLFPLAELVAQIAECIGQNHPRHGLHQDAIFVGDLIGWSHEDAARSIGLVAFAARRDERLDFIVQDLPVARVVLVPDYEIDLQATSAPIGVGLDQLADQFGMRRIADFQ